MEEKKLRAMLEWFYGLRRDLTPYHDQPLTDYAKGRLLLLDSMICDVQALIEGNTRDMTDLALVSLYRAFDASR